jgi:hypothetical protein
MAEDFPLRISPGTQVVAGRRGTGVVIACSESVPVDYVVRFPSGDEDRFERSELRIRKHVQSDALGTSDLSPTFVDELLTDWVVLRCVTGSRAYGLDDEYSCRPRTCSGPSEAHPSTSSGVRWKRPTGSYTSSVYWP